MTLYAITDGEYSDYHIITVTASLEKAEKIVKLYSRGDYSARIETFEDGEANDDRLPYDVWIDRDGSVEASIADEYNYNAERNVITVRYYMSGYRYRVFVLANDKEHAKKIATDLLAEYKYRKQIEENAEWEKILK